MTSPYEEGSPGAKICLLGEAPARNEMLHRRPFVGAAGDILNRCLHKAGIARGECYITNVFQEPVHKKGSKIFMQDEELWGPTKGFTPAGEQLAQGALERLIKADYNVIVPMGGTAFSLCNWGLEPLPIMKWRGSILATKQGKTIPTIHPASCLYGGPSGGGNFLYQYRIIYDLMKVRREAAFPEMRLPQRTLHISPSYRDVQDWLSQAQTCYHEVAFDIEVLNKQVSCFSVATSEDASMCIPLLAKGGEQRWTLEEEADIWEAFARILADPSIRKVNQNITFDISFLYHTLGIKTVGDLGDPMVAHSLLNPEFPKDLGYLTSIYTDEPYFKDDGKIWAKPWADLDTFHRYNAKDSAVALEIWRVLEPMLDKEGHRIAYDRTMGMVGAITLMEDSGFAVDEARLAVTKKEIERELEAAQEAFDDACDYQVNPLSPKQVMEYFYGHKKVKPYISRNTGKPTADDKALARLVSTHGLKEAKLLQRVRYLSKLLKTYLDVEWDPDGRVRCSYNIRGTWTGRLSSSKTLQGTGMNLQNLHPAFKGFLKGA